MHTKLRRSCSQVDLWSSLFLSLICAPIPEHLPLVRGGRLVCWPLAGDDVCPPPLLQVWSAMAGYRCAAAVRTRATQTREQEVLFFFFLNQLEKSGRRRRENLGGRRTKKKEEKEGVRTEGPGDGISLPMSNSFSHLTTFLSLSLDSLISVTFVCVQPSRGIDSTRGVCEREIDKGTASSSVRTP